MIDNDALLLQFLAVADGNDIVSLTPSQFRLMVAGESPAVLDWLARLATLAGQGSPDAVARFKQVLNNVRIRETLLANGFSGVTSMLVKALVEQFGESRVLHATRQLQQGDAGIRPELAQWIGAVQPNDTAHTASAPQHSGRARAQFDQMPPPPGVHTGQVTQRRAQDNVTPLRPGEASSAPRRTPDDPRTQVRGRNPSPRAQQPSDGAERQYDQHTCYGKDVAVQFENCPTQDKRSRTVMIKIARARGTTCKEGVAWNDSILINLEPHEVQTALHVLLSTGEGLKVRYAGHGRTNSKWFELAETSDDYAGAIRLTVADGDERRSVNIGATDIGEVAAVFARTLAVQLHAVDPALHPLIIRRAYDLYQKNASRRANGRQNGPGPRQGQGGGARYANGGGR